MLVHQLEIFLRKRSPCFAYFQHKFSANHALLNKESFLLATANSASFQGFCLEYFRSKVHVVDTGKLSKTTAKMAHIYQPL